MHQKIAILGCGWLGYPLAIHLQKNGFPVNGSSTTASRLKQLEAHQINAFPIKLTDEKPVGDLEGFLADVTDLLIAVPPGLRKDKNINFYQRITQLIPFIQQSTVKTVIFISSTGVFADDFPFVTYHEDSPANGNSLTAKHLIGIEKALLSETHFHSSIVRFGGLIGEDRHPVSYLAGKTGIANPLAPVNLIHQEDCIALLTTLLQQKEKPRIVHGVHPDHPSKEDYYQQVARTRALVVPEFKSAENKGKIIDARETQSLLKFRFEKSLYQ